MAHLWRRTASKEWSALDVSAGRLSLNGSVSADTELSEATGGDPAVLLRLVADRVPETWILLADCKARVRINGLALPLGIVALDDRDEIRIEDGSPLFFTTEKLAVIERYPAGGPRAMCPRCKQPIEGLAVRCPACDLWYHETDDLPCWTHAPQCVCSQPTALDTGFRWTPEAL